jgi:thiol:disulfide interchange protein DsbD
MINKKITLTIFTLCLLLLNTMTHAQIFKPVKWEYQLEPQPKKKGDIVELVLKAKIQDGWHLYANDFDPNLGPLLTTIKLNTHPSFALVDKLKSINPKHEYDDVWEGTVSTFEKTGEFRQKIKILNDQYTISGNLHFQACSTACIDDNLPIQLSGQIAQKSNSTNATLQAEIDTSITKTNNESDVQDSGVKQQVSAIKSNINANNEAKQAQDSEDSILVFMLLAFISGLTALITPCVFPMIPMTVSFFTHSFKDRKKAVLYASVYGISIVLIYTFIGTLFALIFGAEAASIISTHWLPNMIFFAVFIIFAMSFLGMFEITLPSWLVNKVDQQSEKGGLYGVFFMALTIVLVSFSCTGPIASTLLVQAQGGNLLKPALGMFAFGLAFAIPFTLFAFFPSWLKSLPKSGSWLNTVKVFLGFIELALAFKFFSIADQAYHWNILDRDIYLAILIAISIALSMYLMGRLRLAYDEPSEPIGVPRLFIALAVLSFGIYLIPGLFGAPLRALSGYLPPIHTQEFVLSNGNGEGAVQNTACEKPLYSEFLFSPEGVNGYFDLEQAKACAKASGKPVFIDFTGHSCVNCREMEQAVFTDPTIKKKFQNDFVFVSLFGDDKSELPKNKQVIGSDGNLKTTLGEYVSDLQLSQFKSNARPQYIIIDAEGNLLTKEPRYRDLDIQKFNNFLDEGIQNFKKK